MKILILLFASTMIAAPLCHRVSSSSQQTVCPHQAQVDAWHAWRANNPHAHSRYAHGDNISSSSLNLFDARARLSAYEIVDEEPAPDPSFGGCGCDAATALAADGCGWWHANVYMLSRSFNELVKAHRPINSNR